MGFVIFIILTTLDVMLTYVGVTAGGFHEGNPLILWVAKYTGLTHALLLSGGVRYAAAIVLESTSEPPMRWKLTNYLTFFICVLPWIGLVFFVY